MNLQLFLSTLILFSTFGQTKSNPPSNALHFADLGTRKIEVTAANSNSLSDKNVKFLWVDKKYDQELKDTINSIFINEDFCNKISDPERAALGFVATFIGNECWWEGEAKEDGSNLKCKILTSLNLGYQCSDKHLGFLRKWFENDKKSLEELTDCPTCP